MVYANKAPYFIDYLAEQLKALYPSETLSSLGLSIYTTLDTQVQAAAERALANGLSRLETSYPQLSRSEPGKKTPGCHYCYATQYRLHPGAWWWPKLP